ncbi:MAG: SO_0444 family Cu/Zn efflux transporter [Muribaculaceae bacterium]|nr:SO_0444 family Cu/Zn efflux transporter [Muribaculaceae bacterium]
MNYINAFLMMLHEMSPYLLLGFLIAGVLHAFVPTSVYARYLSGTGWRSVGAAALFGIPLPLCSCGVLPTAVSLRRGGASRAAATSFLIATPQTGVDSIAATYSMMGLPFAILRPVAALVTAMLGGNVVGAIERRGHLEDTDGCGDSCATAEALKPTLAGRAWEALRYGFYEMIQNIGRWLVLGLVVATLITVLVPDDFFQTYARWPLLNMVVIVLVAVPMYICATGSIPIAAALMMKGLSPGCALVMLMAGPAANMASMLVISKSFGRKAMWAYLASIVLGAIAFGVVVDYWPGLRQIFVDAMPHHHGAMSHHMSVTWLNWVCSIFLIVMLVVGMASNYWKSYKIKQNKTIAMKEFKVRGMMCNHCKATVEKGLAQLDGAEKVTVDLAQGIAYVEGNVDEAAVRAKVVELGFENG